MYRFSNLSLSRLKGVHPNLVKVLMESIKDSPYDFSIIQGVRTAAEQNELYKYSLSHPNDWRTNCDGYKKKSNHQIHKDGFGHAIDFGIYNPKIEGHIDWKSHDKYAAVAKHILSVADKLGIKNVESGLFWTKKKDEDHIELVD